MDEQSRDLSSRESSAKSLSFAASSTSIDNGSFETGDFKNWRTIGDTSIETSIGTGSLKIFPSDGNHQALMTNGFSDAGGSVVDSDLEEFLDLAPGSLDGLVGGNATEGSVIKQTFTAKAGDIVSFDWNFLTNEATPSGTFNDTAFLSVNGFTFELADTGEDFVPGPDPEFNEQTDTQTLTFSIAAAGTYTIGFGVVDVGDAIFDSGLVIDNIQQTQSLGSSANATSKDSSTPDVDLIFGANGFESADSGSVSDSNPSLRLGESGFEEV